MLIFAKSAYGPNAVAEGRNNTKAFGFNAHAEGMSGAFVVIKISDLDRIIVSKNRRNV